MAVAELTLMRLTQPSNSVLSTLAEMCSSGSMIGTKIWRWMM